MSMSPLSFPPGILVPSDFAISFSSKKLPRISSLLLALAKVAPPRISGSKRDGRNPVGARPSVLEMYLKEEVSPTIS